MKNLAKLNGAKALSKNEQKSINGGTDTNWCARHANNTICGGFACSRCYGGECLPFDHPVFAFPQPC